MAWGITESIAWSSLEDSAWMFYEKLTELSSSVYSQSSTHDTVPLVFSRSLLSETLQESFTASLELFLDRWLTANVEAPSDSATVNLLFTRNIDSSIDQATSSSVMSLVIAWDVFNTTIESVTVLRSSESVTQYLTMERIYILSIE
jgi:hypothetical protein